MSASPLFTSYSIWGLVEMTAQVACSSPAVASAILIDTQQWGYNELGLMRLAAIAMHDLFVFVSQISDSVV